LALPCACSTTQHDNNAAGLDEIDKIDMRLAVLLKHKHLHKAVPSYTQPDIPNSQHAAIYTGYIGK
jgi:hypothetical protein